MKSGYFEGHSIVSRLQIYLFVKRLLKNYEQEVRSAEIRRLAEIMFLFGKLWSYSVGSLSESTSNSSFPKI